MSMMNRFRYLLAEPCHAGNPVFSIVQSDIIITGQICVGASCTNSPTSSAREAVCLCLRLQPALDQVAMHFIVPIRIPHGVRSHRHVVVFPE
jgi:hypothetical protein